MQEYNDTKAELEIAKISLEDLEEQKVRLLLKCTNIVKAAPNIKIKKFYNNKTKKYYLKECVDENRNIKGKNKLNKPIDDYLIESEKQDLDNKIKEKKETIIRLTKKLKKMEAPLRIIKGYEKRIYIYILDGYSPTQAVEKVAGETEQSVRNMWRYYNKLHPILKKYKIIEENSKMSLKCQ